MSSPQQGPKEPMSCQAAAPEQAQQKNSVMCAQPPRAGLAPCMRGRDIKAQLFLVSQEGRSPPIPPPSPLPPPPPPGRGWGPLCSQMQGQGQVGPAQGLETVRRARHRVRNMHQAVECTLTTIIQLPFWSVAIACVTRDDAGEDRSLNPQQSEELHKLWSIGSS